MSQRLYRYFIEISMSDGGKFEQYGRYSGMLAASEVADSLCRAVARVGLSATVSRICRLHVRLKEMGLTQQAKSFVNQTLTA